MPSPVHRVNVVPTHPATPSFLPSFLPSSPWKVCLSSSLPSRDYLPLHPADWDSTATLPRGCLQPCSNQSKASSFTTCTHGSAAAEREEEKEGNSLGRDGDGEGRKEGERSLEPLGPGRKCGGERERESGGRSRGKTLAANVSPSTPSHLSHMGSLGTMVTGRRKRAEHRERTDGDRGRCKRRRIAKCKKAKVEAKPEMRSTAYPRIHGRVRRGEKRQWRSNVRKKVRGLRNGPKLENSQVRDVRLTARRIEH